MTIEEELQDLRRRVNALEEALFRKHRTRSLIVRILEAWPGPFTVQQINDALKEFHPAVFAELKPYHVANLVGGFERSSCVTRVTDGKGCVGALFKVIGKLPDGTGRPGTKFNRQAKYESGFRHIVRSALADLPEQFTLEDLRRWMGEHMPEAKIPYGSWSSTLYKLTQSQELICVKGRGSNCSAKRKVWMRGPVRVAASGEELTELESAWSEFRKSMQTQPAEYLTPSERGEPVESV